jgi:hypothetical protein
MNQLCGNIKEKAGVVTVGTEKLMPLHLIDIINRQIRLLVLNKRIDDISRRIRRSESARHESSFHFQGFVSATIGPVVRAKTSEAKMKGEMRSVRHAAVLAMVGWYATAPPFVRVGNKLTVDGDAPLGQWQAYGSFDRASDCEQAIHLFQHSLAPDPNRQEQRKFVLCVATDDPRLKEK